MRNELTNAIVEYIFSNFGIIDSISNSLFDKAYKLKDVIQFEDGVSSDLYSCKLTISNKEIIILATDIEDNGLHDYYMIIQLQDHPAYGLFLNVNESDSLICCIVPKSNQDWMICNIYLQAVLLTAMEEIKQIPFNWKPNFSCKEQIDYMNKFIKYHVMISDGESDAG